MRRARLGDPGCVGRGQRLRALEEGGGFGEGLCEEAELRGDEGCGGQGGRRGWGELDGQGGGVGQGEGEELDGVVEEGVEGYQGRKGDGGVGGDGVELLGVGSQAEGDGLR